LFGVGTDVTPFFSDFPMDSLSPYSSSVSRLLMNETD